MWMDEGKRAHQAYEAFEEAMDDIQALSMMAIAIQEAPSVYKGIKNARLHSSPLFRFQVWEPLQLYADDNGGLEAELLTDAGAQKIVKLSGPRLLPLEKPPVTDQISISSGIRHPEKYSRSYSSQFRCTLRYDLDEGVLDIEDVFSKPFRLKNCAPFRSEYGTVQYGVERYIANYNKACDLLRV